MQKSVYSRIVRLIAILLSISLFTFSGFAFGSITAADIKLQSGETSSSGLMVSITYGEQKNKSESHIRGEAAQASHIQAGGKANLTATGGKQSEITITGSDVAGKAGTNLIADNDINIEAAEQRGSERSKNTSSGWNAGVAITFGEGVAFGFTASGNRGKGHGNGDSVAYRNSHVGDGDSATVIQTGNKLDIRGGQVLGDSIKVDAKDLSIASLQDSAVYDSKQKNISAQVTVGYGVSASGSFSKSKIKADHLAVSEQSGILAGDEGFQVAIQNHTDLKGGIVTSTAKAEENKNNRFTTGTISTSDIANHSRYDAKGFAIGGGFSISGEDLGQGGRDDNPHLQNVADTSGVITPTQGYGKDSDKQSNITQSGIGTSNITITDKTNPISAEQIKTTKTTEQVLADSGLQNRFDKDEVQSEIDLQVKVTQQFDENRQKLKKELLNKAKGYFAKAQEERIKNGGEDNETSLALEAEGHKLSQTVSYIDTALGALWGSADGLGLATKQVVAQHADYAKNAGKHVTAGQIYKVDCSGGAAQYYCKDINGIAENKDGSQWQGGAKEIYDVSELNNKNGNVIISNPGIYNIKSDAFRNAVKQNPEAARNGNLYVVLNNPSYGVIPGLSEIVFYAGYDKINDILGAKLPLTNAEKTNVAINTYAKEKGLKVEKSNHSRGGITESVSLQRTNNMGITNVPIVESRFFGTATNVEDYLKQIRENGYDTTTVKQATHQADPVGRPPIILGGNSATGGDCWWCYSHSSYYGEVPEEFLKHTDNTPKLDENGEKIKNPEYEKYTQIWGEPKTDTDGKPINSSLPKEVILENNKIKFKGGKE